VSVQGSIAVAELINTASCPWTKTCHAAVSRTTNSLSRVDVVGRTTSSLSIVDVVHGTYALLADNVVCVSVW